MPDPDGLRISEFYKLDLRDLDPDQHQALVRNGKGGKDRIVPLSGSLDQQIRLFVGDRRAGPIFERVTIRTLQRWYDDAIRAAGIEKEGGPHTARHTSATILRAKGFSLEDIQLILGHSSRITTEVYAKLTFTPEIRDRYLPTLRRRSIQDSMTLSERVTHDVGGPLYNQPIEKRRE